MLKTMQSAIIAGCCALSSTSFAADWSQTEVIFAKGKLLNPYTSKDESTNIITFQHASSWKYGANFFFIDHVTMEANNEFYGEWYPTFSSNKIFGAEYGGIIKDIGMVAGFNAAPDIDVLKYLPGVQVDFDFAGFNYAGAALTAYIDQTRNSAFEEGNSYMLDTFWQYPFNVGDHTFSFEGHGEYIGGRKNKFTNEKLKGHWLIQPQIRWDAGKAIFGEENLVQLGMEWQHWRNKYGTKKTENSLKFLFIWKL